MYVMVNRSRRDDTKIAHLVRSLTASVQKIVVVEHSQTLLQALRYTMEDGWIMSLPDDSLVDVYRLVHVFTQFLATAGTSDVLLPYKTMDSCNLGASMNRDMFYRLRSVVSFRGMIIHSSKVAQALVLGAQDERPKHSVERVSTTPPHPGREVDPMGLVRCRDSGHGQGQRQSVRKEEGEDEDEDEEAKNRGGVLTRPEYYVHDFNLPLGCGEQYCTVPGLTFFTVYPNVVTYDASYASRRSDMAQLNECSNYPSTIEQYVTDLAYDNMYKVLMVILLVTVLICVVYARYRRHRRSYVATRTRTHAKGRRRGGGTPSRDRTRRPVPGKLQ